MSATSCLLERFSAFTIGVVLLVGGLGAVVIGLTVLPVLGLVFAVPFFLLSAYFIRVHFNKQCEITS